MIKVFVSEHCSPCEQIKRLIAEKQLEVELVDVGTDEGYAEFYAQVLAHQDGALPSAYKDGKQCSILLSEEEDDLIIECPSSSETE